MTSVIEIPTEDLRPEEFARVELTSPTGVRLRFSRLHTHPFHIGIAVHQKDVPYDAPLPMFFLPLDTLRDLGVYLTSVGVQLTKEWHDLTSEQQSAYLSAPVPEPHQEAVLVDRDDLRYMLAELEMSRDTQAEMQSDPLAVASMRAAGFSDEDVQEDIDRMTAILETYGNLQ